MVLDFWQFDTNDITKVEQNVLECCISDSESIRASRFIFDNDRKRFVLRRAVLRYILSSYMGVPPSQITYKITEYGKPILVGSPYQFSLSSTDGKVTILIGCNIDFGVDIEKVKPLNDVDGLINLICSEDEQAWISLFKSKIEREKNVFILWTIKEAYLKMRGHGLSIDPRRITVKTEEQCLNASRILYDDIEQNEISIVPITGHLSKGLIGHAIVRSRNHFSFIHKYLPQRFSSKIPGCLDLNSQS